MDRARRERRIGILVVILVLLAVVLFWMVYPHNSLYSSYRRNARLKKALENIHQPAGDDPGTIEITSLPGTNILSARGAYSSKSDCATVEARYKQEFARQGFTYSDTKTESRSLFFTSRDYGASMVCSERYDKMGSLYVISMWPNSHA